MKYATITKKFIENLYPVLKEQSVPLGLAYGKTGYSIFFYCLGRLTQNEEYTQQADKLLNDVYTHISQVTSIDLKNGLSGIGLGIRFLSNEGYIEGDINYMLQDLDDEIFKVLSNPKEIESLTIESFIHILYYLSIRYEERSNSFKEKELHKGLIIVTLNNLYKKIVTPAVVSFEEPYCYNVEYILPQLLYGLANIYQLNFYKERIEKIVTELSPVILSTLPLLHANRLYLLWGMNAVSVNIQIDGWREHMNLLGNNLNFEVILNKELKNKHLFFKNGLTSMYLLAHSLRSLPIWGNFSFPELQREITKRIESSEAWTILSGKSIYENHYDSNCLYTGFSSVILLIHFIQTKIECDEN